MTVEDIFKDLPTLESPRLILRKLTLDDAADVFAYASNPEVARFLSWRPHESLETSRAFVDWVVEQYQSGSVAPWGVSLRETGGGTIIGSAGFIDWDVRDARAELGYALHAAYWGRGLATEAVKGIVKFSFESTALNRMQATVESANVASIRVLEKAGFSREGTLKQYVFSKGEFLDLEMYCILRREWLALARRQ